jgi:hypothetical protein
MYEKQKKDGKISECLFADKMKKMNITTEESSIRHNMYLHYDFKTKNKNKTVLVEVKGSKHRKRHDDKYSGDICIEFVGVAGKAGWLYGKADYLAFQLLDNNFLIVPRKELMETATKHVFLSELNIHWSHVNKEDEIINNFDLYNRKDRLDLFTWIPFDIIKNIKGTIII